MPATDCQDKDWASLDLSRDLLKDKRERGKRLVRQNSRIKLGEVYFAENRWLIAK